MLAGKDALLARIASAHIDHKYSDLTIQCDTQIWRVHKLIVCTASKFFDKACEGDWLEARNNVIDLHDESASVISRMIDYMYTADFTDTSLSHETHGPLLLNVKMFIAADKYDVSGLQELAQLKFEDTLRQVSNMEARFHFGQDFNRAVRELYEAAPDSAQPLRKHAVQAVLNRASSLFGAGFEGVTGGQVTSFQTLLSDVPSFGAEVVVGLTATLQKGVADLKAADTWRCGGFGCTAIFRVVRKPGSDPIYCPHCRCRAAKLG